MDMPLLLCDLASSTVWELDEAEKGELSFQACLSPDQRGESAGLLEDVWDVLRQCLQADQEGKFKWQDKEAKDKFTRAYEKCKGHLIALTDIIITTNGNAQCRELIDHWGRAEELYGKLQQHGVQEVKAVGIFIDEVAKEQELSIFNTLCSPAMPREADLVAFFGDPK